MRLQTSGQSSYTPSKLLALRPQTNEYIGLHVQLPHHLTPRNHAQLQAVFTHRPWGLLSAVAAYSHVSHTKAVATSWFVTFPAWQLSPPYVCTLELHCSLSSNRTRASKIIKGSCSKGQEEEKRGLACNSFEIYKKGIKVKERDLFYAREGQLV